MPFRARRLLLGAFAALTLTFPAWADTFDHITSLIQQNEDAAAIAAIERTPGAIQAKTPGGDTLLHFAANANNLEIIEYLVGHGADPAARNQYDQTPYDQAGSAMVKAYLKARVEGQPTAVANASPVFSREALSDQRSFEKLRAQIEQGNDALALALLDRGFPVDAKDAEGYTMLHYAAGANRPALVKELIRRGADANAKSNRGFTPFDMGQFHPEVASALKSAGGRYGQMQATVKPKASSGGKTSAASSSPNQKECGEKWYADQALCSDSTCKMRAYRHYDQCLRTGNYW